MVPGAPGGWAELNRRFGTRPLEELFAPAASYAREGVAVPVNVAVQWHWTAPVSAGLWSGTRPPTAPGGSG